MKTFADYYARHRCPGSPYGPGCVLDVARGVKARYSRLDGITNDELLSYVYDALGDETRGLFHDFRPEAYTGPLPVERHFCNLFETRLRNILSKAARKATRDAYKYRVHPAFEPKARKMKSGEVIATRAAPKDAPTLPTRYAPKKGLLFLLVDENDLTARRSSEWSELIEKAKGCLTNDQRMVINSHYNNRGPCLSFRQIAAVMRGWGKRVDHESVSMMHKEAVERMRPVVVGAA